MFTIKGECRLGDEPVEITWDNGELSGDPEAVEQLLIVAKGMEGREVGPVGGPYTEHNHLRDPISTATLIGDFIFERILESTGVPRRGPAPPGAII